MLLEQGAALTLGHTAPDAELHTIVEGVGSAFGDHRTVPADDRGFALRSTANKQLIGIRRPAQSLRDPGYAGFPVDPWK